jgi:glycosyltransferase involved in cell wall biosynthesis
MTRRRTRVLRVITRLNIGGPALHAALLSTRLDPERFETLLVAGREGATEGSMLELGRLHEGLALRRVPSLGREISGLDDLRALAAVTSIAREFRPDIVHTHLAKAGTVGRLAARASGARAVIHTYHGTVFKGYFGTVKTRAFIAIERGLARLSTRLVAITPSQRRELIKLGIGDERKIVEIPLGLELEQFRTPLEAVEARRRLGLPQSTPIVAIVARLVPVKNISLFLRALAIVNEPVLAVIVGDGEERAALEAHTKALGIELRVRFLGWQRDIAAVYAAADIVALTSLNEGSPVSLIEAMAAGRAVVSTAVGGVPDVVTDGVSGVLVPSGDAEELAGVISALLREPERRHRLGQAARQAAYPLYDVSRLLTDVTRLYQSLVPGA